MRLMLGHHRGRPLSLREHLDVHGPLPHRPKQLSETLADAGLTGRGGAAFPLATKMRTVAGAKGRPVVVVNAAESEPASAKDRWLAAHVPHLVLDGAQAAAESVGAKEVILWLHRGATTAEQSLAGALHERRAAGLPSRRTTIVLGPDRYVAGEASAIVHRLSGGPALPTMSPHRTAERGVGGRPTLLSNAETFAHVGLIARHGSRWFREEGTDEEPGTMLATVRGAVRRPGVVEVGVGTAGHEVLRLAGGATEPLSAYLVGGYGGTWLGADAARGAALSRASLRPLGVDLGVGLVLAFPASRCALAETERLLGWLAAESSGQCGPCVNGLPAIATRFSDLMSGHAAAGGLEDIRRWAGLVTGRGACHHPDGAVRLLRSAVNTFGDHLDEHVRSGRCSDVVSSPIAPLPHHGAVAGKEDWR